ncbi:MAG: peptidylprolyl isomerase [Mariprofundaceae bacterium]
MRNLLLIPTAMLLLFVGACQQQGNQPQTIPTSPPAARIGDTTIYESDIDAAINALPEKLHLKRDDPELRAHLLRVLLRRQALSRHAEDLHLEQDPAIHLRIVKARDDILIESLQRWKMNHLPESDAASVEAYYNSHLSEFTIPEQVHARHILLANEKQAKKVLHQLKKGKDFATLAAEKSRDDGSKARGGDLNWFPRGVMVKAFEEKVFALKKTGQYAGPVKTRFGWHVIELLGKRPANRQSLAEVRSDIAGILKQQALNAWFDERVAAAGADIINPQYRQQNDPGQSP